MLNNFLCPERESMSRIPLDRAYSITLEHIVRLEVEMALTEL